jgi:hypothetical protein
MGGDYFMILRGRREMFRITILLSKRIQISFIRTFLIPSVIPIPWTCAFPIVTNIEEDTDCSDGVIVLSTDWILDSLDARIFLPIRHYTVTGLVPPPWSTLPLYPVMTIDPIKSLKNAIHCLFGPKSTAQKRPLQGMETEEARKKRLFVAVNGVELALQRLRQVTRSPDVEETSLSGNEGNVSTEVGMEHRKRGRGAGGYEIEDSCAGEGVGKSSDLEGESQNEDVDGSEGIVMDDEVEQTSVESTSSRTESWDSMDEMDLNSESRSNYLEQSPTLLDDGEDEVDYDTSHGISRTESFNSDIYHGTPEIKVETTYLTPPTTVTTLLTPSTTTTTTATPNTTTRNTNSTPATSPTQIFNSPSPVLPSLEIWNRDECVNRTFLDLTSSISYDTPSPLPQGPNIHNHRHPTPFFKTPPPFNSPYTPNVNPSTPIKLEGVSHTDLIPRFDSPVPPSRDQHISTRRQAVVRKTRAKYPIERFPEFITPRSPARQERLRSTHAATGSRKKMTSRIRDKSNGSVSSESTDSDDSARAELGSPISRTRELFLNSHSRPREVLLSNTSTSSRDNESGETNSFSRVSREEDDIYLPVLKATSTQCEKVWDVEILGLDLETGKFRLTRAK